MRAAVFLVLPVVALAALNCGPKRPPDSQKRDEEEAGLNDPIRLSPIHVRANVEGKHRGRIPIDAYDVEALFDRALLSFEKERFQESALLYRRVASEFPESRLAAPALYNSGLAMERIGDYQGAIADYSLLCERYPGSEDVKDALFRTAGAYEALMAWEAVVDALDKLISTRKDLESIERVECLVRQGVALVRMGKTETARERLEQGISLFKRDADISKSESPYFLGMAQFALGEILEAKMREAPLPADESILEKALELKCRLLLDAQSAYTEAIRIAHPHWAAAAAYRIGALYRALFDDMLSAPLPDDLDEEERQVYTEILQKRIRALLEKAVRQWERVLKMADRLGLENEWVEQTEKDLEEVRAKLALDSRGENP